MSEANQALVREFRPPIGLRHPHVQSILGGSPLRRRSVNRRARDFVKDSVGKIVDCGDGVRLAGRLSSHGNGALGTVAVLHGWEGSGDSNYMLSIGARLFASRFDVFRLNFRDHGGTQALNEGLFHSCRIDEVVGAVAALDRASTARPFFLVGYSLGGNFALRVAARAQAAGIDLTKVVAVCPVLNPHSTMRALEEGLWVYRHYFLQKWRKSLVAKAAAFPGLYEFGDLRRFATLTETTDFFVRGYTPYANLDEYLSGYAITGTRLADLAVDSTLITTRDDPVIPIEDLEDVAQSPALKLRVEPLGGHCACIETFGLRSWLDDAVVGELVSSL